MFVFLIKAGPQQVRGKSILSGGQTLARKLGYPFSNVRVINRKILTPTMQTGKLVHINRQGVEVFIAEVTIEQVPTCERYN